MDNIKVAVRVRPLIQKEKGQSNNWITKENTIATVEANGKTGTPYAFDRVFDDSYTTYDIFDEFCKPITDAAVEGFNGTVFAYGQSSSGKTYTMSGSALQPGIVPLGIREIFTNIENISDREFLVRVSYMEIYNEKVSDLLDAEEKLIRLQEDVDRNIIVSGLSEHMVKDTQSILELIKQGDARRHMAETKQNDRSSRSHCITRINFVDLAGSEKAGDNSGARFREGCQINKSLLTLSLVIRKLSDGESNQHISYRDSKLTRILQNALGGNSKTAIIATITPASIEESHSTLRFASRAKTISTHAHVNETLSDAAMLRKSQLEIEKLKKEIQEMKKQELPTEWNELMQKLAEKEEKINNLNNFILCGNHEPVSTNQVKKKRRETWCPGLANRRHMNNDILNKDISFGIQPLIEELEEESIFGNLKDISPPTITRRKRSIGESDIQSKKPRVMFSDQPTESRRSFEDKCWNIAQGSGSFFDADSPENNQKSLVTMLDEHEKLLNDHRKLQKDFKELSVFHEDERSQLVEMVDILEAKMKSMMEEMEQKTKLCTEASQDRKEMEGKMNLACDETYELQHKLDITTRKLADCQQELSNLRNAQKEVEKNTSQKEEQDIVGKTSLQEEELMQLRSEVEKQKTNISDLRNIIEEKEHSHKATVEMLQSSLEDFKQKAELYKETIEEFQIEKSNLGNQVSTLRQELTHNVKTTSDDKQVDYENEIESYKEMIEKLTFDLEDLQERMEMKESIENSKNDMHREENVVKLESRVTELNEELQKYRDSQDSHIENIQREYEEKLKNYQDQIEGLTQQITDAKSERESQQLSKPPTDSKIPDLVQNYEAKIESLQSELQALKSGSEERKDDSFIAQTLELRQCNQKIVLYEETLKEFQIEKASLEEKVASLQQKILEHEKSNDETKNLDITTCDRVQCLESEVELYKELVETLNSDLKELQAKMDMKDAVENPKNDADQETVSQLESQVAVLKEKLEKHQNSQDSYVENVRKEYEEKLQKYQDQIALLMQQVTNFKSEEESELSQQYTDSKEMNIPDLVQSYEAKIESLQSELQALKSGSEDGERRDDSIIAQIELDEYKEKSTLYEETVKEFQTENAYLEEKVKSLQQKLLEHENPVESKQYENATSDRVQCLESEVELYKELVEKLNCDLKELQEKAEQQVYDDKSLQRLTESSKAEYENYIEQLKSQVSSLTGEYEEQIEELKGQLSSLTTKYKEQIEELKIQTSTQQKDVLMSEISGLSSVHEKIIEAESQKSNLSKEHKGQIEELKNQMSSLTTQHKEEIQGLHTEMSNLTSKYEERIEELMAHVSSLKKETNTNHVEQMDHKIIKGNCQTKNESEIERLKMQVISLKEEMGKSTPLNDSDEEFIKAEYEIKLQEYEEKIRHLTKQMTMSSGDMQISEVMSDHASGQENKRQLLQQTHSHISECSLDITSRDDQNKSKEEYEQIINGLNQELMTLKEDIYNETMQKIEREKELSEMKEKYESVKSEHEERTELVQKLWEEKEQLEKDFEARLEESQVVNQEDRENDNHAQFEERIERLKVQHSEEVDRLKHEISSLNYKLSMYDYEDETFSIRTTDLRDLTDKRLEMECKLNTQKSEFEKEKEEMSRLFQKEKEEFERRRIELETKLRTIEEQHTSSTDIVLLNDKDEMIETSDLRRKVSEHEEEKYGLMKKLEEIEEENTTLLTQIAEMKEEMSGLKNPVELMEQFQSIVEQLKQEHVQELDLLKSENEGKEEELLAKCQIKEEELLERYQVKEKELLASCQIKEEELLNRCHIKEEELATMTREKGEICEELQTLKQHNDDLQQKVGNLESSDTLCGYKDDHNKELESMRSEFECKEEELLARCQFKEEELLARYQSKEEELLASYQIKEEELLTRCQYKEEELMALTREKGEMCEEIQTLKEHNHDLQQKVDNLESSDTLSGLRDDHSKELESMRSEYECKEEELLARCQFKEEELLARYQSKEEELLASYQIKEEELLTRCQYKEEELMALTREKGEMCEEIQTLKEHNHDLQQKVDNLESSDTLSGLRDDHSKESALNELRSAYEKKEEELIAGQQVKERELIKATQEIEDMSELLKTLQQNSCDLKLKVDNLEARNCLHESQVEQNKELVQSLQKQINILVKENETLRQDGNAKQDLVESLKKQVHDLSKENTEIKQEDVVKELQSTMRILRSEYEQKEQEFLSKYQIKEEELRRATQNREQMNDQIKTLKQNCSDLTHKVDDLETRNLHSESQVEQNKELQSTMRMLRSEYEQKEEEFLSKYQIKEEELRIATQSIQEMNEQIKTLKQNCSDLTHRMNDVETRSTSHDSQTEQNNQVVSLQEQIDALTKQNTAMKQEEFVKKLKLKERIVTLQNKKESVEKWNEYLQEKLKSIEEGKQDEEIYKSRRMAEEKVDELIRELEVMEKEEKILKNANAEKDRIISDLQQQIQKNSQGKLVEAKNQAEKEFRESHVKILVLEDKLRAASKRLETNKESFEKTEIVYKEEINRLKNEIRRLQDFDSTYIQMPSVPVQPQPCQVAEPPVNGQDAGAGGGVVDQFANLLLEGTNKRLTKEIKSLKTKLEDCYKKISDSKTENQKKSSEIERMKQQISQLQKTPLADNNTSAKEQSIKKEVPEPRFKLPDMGRHREERDLIGDIDAEKLMAKEDQRCNQQ